MRLSMPSFVPQEDKLYVPTRVLYVWQRALTKSSAENEKKREKERKSGVAG
jgi:hypothetical protein